MRIQLINAPMKKSEMIGGEIVSTMWPPYALMCLSSYLVEQWKKDLGEDSLPQIRITDGVLVGEEETRRRILEFKPDLIGFTFLTPNSTGAYDLINSVRAELKYAVIVCGGVHATALPEDALGRSSADFICYGEGEKTFYELARHCDSDRAKIKELDGVCYLDDQSGDLVRNPCRKPVEIDELPLPGFDFLDEVKPYKGFRFKKKDKELFVMSTRGCPFNCCFCSNVVWKTAKPHFRMRTPSDYVDKLEALIDRYDAQEIFDMADEFNCSMKWALEVCNEIIKRKLDIAWKCQLRVDKVTDELARTLKEAGCWYVHIGAETGNPKTLDGIGKKITLSQIEESCRILRRHGIKVNALFMLFNIWEEGDELHFENVDDNIKTLYYAGNLLRKDLVSMIGVTITTPYPGSQLYNITKKRDIIKEGMDGRWEKWNQVWSVSVDLPGVYDEDVRKLKAEAGRLQARYLYKMLFMINYKNLKGLFLAKGLGLLKVQFGLLKSKMKKTFSG